MPYFSIYCGEHGSFLELGQGCLEYHLRPHLQDADLALKSILIIHTPLSNQITRPLNKRHTSPFMHSNAVPHPPDSSPSPPQHASRSSSSAPASTLPSTPLPFLTSTYPQTWQPSRKRASVLTADLAP